MKGLRGERLNSEFQKEIYSIINSKLRGRYPEMSAVISVTKVDIAPDLKNAKVFVSIYEPNEEKKENTFLAIKSNVPFIKHELSKVMYVRTIPNLHFLLDGTMEYGTRIDKILSDLHIEDNPDEE